MARLTRIELAVLFPFTKAVITEAALQIERGRYYQQLILPVKPNEQVTFINT
jgi:hypothetical protein